MKNYLIGIVFFAGMLLYSCADELDITPPSNITTEQIKKILASGDTTKINLIMNSMANAMPTQFNASGISGGGTADGRYRSCQGLDYMRNLEANDIVFGAKNLSIFGSDEYYLRDFISTAVDKNVIYWHHAWSIITTANKMLNYLDDATVGSSPRLKEYKARGLVIRAYAYNYLMENYQDAYLQGGKDKPGIMLYDYYSPTQPYKPRATSTETFNFIRKDLQDAVRLLGESGISFTTGVLTDIDLGVANFLLARVSLMTGDWSTAITACDAILAKYPTLMGEKDVLKIAQYIYEKQVEQVAEALKMVIDREDIKLVVTTGLGMDIIGLKAAETWGLDVKTMDEILTREDCVVAPAVGTALLMEQYCRNSN